MFKLLLLIALIPALAYAQTPFTRCTHAGAAPPPTRLRILGCDPSLAACPITQGSDAQIEVDFRAARQAVTLRPSVRAWVSGSVVPYNLPARFQDGCQHIRGARCPLPVGSEATYSLAFPITTVYPPIRVGVELTMTDNHGAKFCAIVQVQVRLAPRA